MMRFKWSPKQVAHRARMAEAVRHYRAIRDDPDRAARYRLLAQKAGLSASAYAIREFMRATKPGGESKSGGDQRDAV